MKIVIDTSFIVACMKKKIDFLEKAEELFDEGLDWLVPLEVMQELEKLSQQKGEKTENKQASLTAIDFIKSQDLSMIPLQAEPSPAHVDDLIVSYVNEHSNEKPVVATIDKEFKQRVHELGLKTLVIKDMKSLGID
jgi:rRNA-processing protein FCF1